MSDPIDEWTEFFVNVARNITEEPDGSFTAVRAPNHPVPSSLDLRRRRNNRTPDADFNAGSEEAEEKDEAEHKDENDGVTVKLEPGVDDPPNSSESDDDNTRAYGPAVPDEEEENQTNGQSEVVDVISKLLRKQQRKEQKRIQKALQRLKKQEAKQRKEQETIRKIAAASVEPEPEEEHVNTDLERDAETKLNSGQPFGPRVVFLDLEWHTLDKRTQLEETEEIRKSVVTAHICQICAVSCDYTLRFNQYIRYRKLKKPWRQMVEDWQILEYSPQDDPRIAISLEDCLELMLDTFLPDTLFLYYGHTDAMAIFKSLYADAEYDPTNKVTDLTSEQFDRREAIRRRILAANWKWSNIMPWMKETTLPMCAPPSNIEVKGSLGQVYDTLFHRSLLTTLRTPQSVQPEIKVHAKATQLLRELVVDIEVSWQQEHPDKLGLVPRRWIEVKNNRQRNSPDEKLFKNMNPEFWPTQRLQPVFHMAHTDTIMLGNCVAMIMLYADSYERFAELWNNDKIQQKLNVYLERNNITDMNQVSTIKTAWSKAGKRTNEYTLYVLASVVAEVTGCFRRFQLALSEDQATRLFAWHVETPGRCSQSKDLVRRIYLQACKLTGTPASEAQLEALDQDTPSDEFEVEKVLDAQLQKFIYNPEVDAEGWEKFNGKLFLRYQVKFKNHTETDWLWADQMEKAEGAIKEWLIMNGHWKSKDTVTKANARLEKEMRLAAAGKAAIVVPAGKLSEQRSKLANEKVKKAERKAEEEEKKERYTVEDFEQPPDKNITLYYVMNEIDESGAVVSDLVYTKRRGKFTDKVKAIRSLLLRVAKESNDEDLLAQLILPKHRFAEKRFSMDPKTSYVGLPWFSFDTTAAEPNTHMLHTMACRNLSDPEDRKKTRNWAELEAMLWDFDLIVKHGMFVNTKFRFCKECKEYTNIADLDSTGDALVDMIQRNAKPSTRQPRLVPVRPAPPVRSQTLLYRPSSPSEASASSGSTNSHSSSSSLVSVYSTQSSVTRRLRDIQLERRTPHRTNTLSYFTLLQARHHSLRIVF